MQGMVEVITPLGMHAVTAGSTRGHDAKVVGIGLSDQVYAPATLLCKIIDHGAQQGQKRLCVAIYDSVDGVQPKSVDMEFVEPVDCVLDEKKNHMIALWTIKIDRLTPRCVIALRKIGAEIS